MGGSGSGNYWRHGAKTCTDEMRALDIRWLHREKLIVVGRASTIRWSVRGEEVGSLNFTTKEDRIVLSYRQKVGDEVWKNESYGVFINWTECTFGGKRPWFLCPSCGQRVAVLYGGRVFACRHCHHLAYRSQQETAYKRMARKADKIREKLGWTLGMLNGPEWKPRGMHWRTFARLCNEQNLYSGRSSSLFMANFKALRGFHRD